MRLLVVDLAQGEQPHAVVGARHRDLGAVVFAQYLRDRQVGIRGLAAELLSITIGDVLVLLKAVQKGCVRRIDADLQRLQPVAVPVALEGEGVGVRRGEAVEMRERGRLAGAQPGEQDPASLGHGIRALPDVLAHPAALRLAGRLQAFAGHVEQPAVERAAHAAVFPAAVGEVGLPVRAMAVEQAVFIVLIFE